MTPEPAAVAALRNSTGRLQFTASFQAGIQILMKWGALVFGR